MVCVVGRMRDLILQLSKSSIYSTKPVRQATKRWSGLDTLARRAPYFSSVLIALVGIYMGYHGWIGVTS